MTPSTGRSSSRSTTNVRTQDEENDPEDGQIRKHAKRRFIPFSAALRQPFDWRGVLSSRPPLRASHADLMSCHPGARQRLPARPADRLGRDRHQQAAGRLRVVEQLDTPRIQPGRDLDARRRNARWLVRPPPGVFRSTRSSAPSSSGTASTSIATTHAAGPRHLRRVADQPEPGHVGAGVDGAGRQARAAPRRRRDSAAPSTRSRASADRLRRAGRT